MDSQDENGGPLDWSAFLEPPRGQTREARGLRPVTRKARAIKPVRRQPKIKWQPTPVEEDAERIRLTAACWYCADIADSIDHCLPKCAAGEETRKVMCCRDCNVRAGAHLFYTMGEKAAFIRDCLVRKYRRLLDSPDWSAIQLSRMGHTMREYILADLALRDRVRMRLRILALRSAVEAPTFKRVG